MYKSTFKNNNITSIKKHDLFDLLVLDFIESLLPILGNILEFNNLFIVSIAGHDIKRCWMAVVLTLLYEFYIVCLGTSKFRFVESFILPLGPNSLLCIIFVIWVYIWGVSNLRRTLFGKFTRGDRKLWFKSFASFWVVELVTVLGLYICSAWMSWGPAPIFHRNFLIPTRGFITELLFFTFIIWGLYLLRFFIKWNSWKTSVFLTLIIIFLVSLLIWRDLISFLGRDTMVFSNNSRWKYVDPQTVRYAISSNWWLYNYVGSDKLSIKFSSSFLSFFNQILTYKEYEDINTLYFLSSQEWFSNSFILFSDFNDYFIDFISFSNDYLEFSAANEFFVNKFFYPRRVGFATKKLAMWTLFIILKMFHHTILFYWWFIFLFRLYSAKKNAYSILSTCWFNVYCCFIIGLLIYIFSFFPFYENFLRLKTLKIRPLLYRREIYYESLSYIYSIIVSEDTFLRPWRIIKVGNKTAFKWLLGETFFPEEIWLQQYHFRSLYKAYYDFKKIKGHFRRSRRFMSAIFDDRYWDLGEPTIYPKISNFAPFNDGFIHKGSLIFYKNEYFLDSNFELSLFSIFYL